MGARRHPAGVLAACLAAAASPQEPVDAPPPDGAALRPACTADRVLEVVPHVRFEHLGFSVDGGWSWDDAADAEDWSADLLVGGSNLYDSNLAPPSYKLDAAVVYLLPPAAELRAGPGGRTLQTDRWVRFVGEQTGDRFGYSAVFAGDLDGKDGGRADVVVGAPRARKPRGRQGFSQRGAVYLFTAGHFAGVAPGETVAGGDACLILEGEVAGDRFGWDVASLDFDGDGVRDLALGAPGCLTDPLFPGRVYLVPGARLRELLAEHRAGRRVPITARLLGTRVLEGRGASDRFGYALAGLGDLDGDGREDLAVGAPSFQYSAHDGRWIEPHPDLPGKRPATGYVAVYRGLPPLAPEAERVGGVATGPADRIVADEQAGAQFGASVAGGIDMDGDGVGELVVGAPLHDRHAGDATDGGEPALLVEAGRADVYSLASEAPALLARVEGDAAGHRFGVAVAALADVDGDGLGDLAIGALLGGRTVTAVPAPEGCGDQGGPRCGRLWIVRGPGAEAGAAVLTEVFGEGAADRLGSGLVSLGDLDGNGLGDLAVGAPGFPAHPGDDHGRTYLILH